MSTMPEKSILEKVKKRFQTRRSEIENESENKLRKLQDKIEQIKKERDARLAKSERRFRQEFCIALKEIVLKEDYDWLIQWLMKNKEMEAEEAEKKLEKERADELKAMSAEDYLFRFLTDPEIAERLKANIDPSKPEDIERLTSIVTKLRLDKAWVDGTLL
jgi:uncharacterized protein YecA (UPF0149 family)